MISTVFLGSEWCLLLGSLGSLKVAQVWAQQGRRDWPEESRQKATVTHSSCSVIRIISRLPPKDVMSPSRPLHAMLTTNSIQCPTTGGNKPQKVMEQSRVILDQEMACLLESEVHVLCIGHSVHWIFLTTSSMYRYLSMLSPFYG